MIHTIKPMRFRLPQKSGPERDAELLEQYRTEKDLRVLGRLYARYMDLVYGLCLKYLKDEEKASDAVMEIFEVLVQKALQHEVREFKPWLYVLAKNHCLMLLRKSGNQREQTFDPAIMYSLSPEHLSEESDAERREDQLKRLEACIDRLPDEQKHCIRLFYLENMTYKTIASQEKLDLGSVRSYIQNGRRNLRNCMES